MTINDCIKKNGIQVDCDHPIGTRWGEVTVAFENSQTGSYDETSFDVSDPLTNDGNHELGVLFKDFCKENQIKSNTVTAIILTKAAETYEELIA